MLAGLCVYVCVRACAYVFHACMWPYMLPGSFFSCQPFFAEDLALGKNLHALPCWMCSFKRIARLSVQRVAPVTLVRQQMFLYKQPALMEKA